MWATGPLPNNDQLDKNQIICEFLCHNGLNSTEQNGRVVTPNFRAASLAARKKQTMKITCIGFVAVAFLTTCLANGQSANDLTIAKGAVTNGTAMALLEIGDTQKALASGNYGNSRPFLILNNDISEANSFFLEPFRVLRTDEMRCSEAWFGRALACKKSAPTVVVAAIVTQPMATIYRYWMDKISADTIKFSQDSSRNCKDPDDCKQLADFAKGIQDDHVDDSVWEKLRAGYCSEIPDGTYSGMHGQMLQCNAQRK